MSSVRPGDSNRPIGVGIIGASPLNPGWALAAHLPAIEALPDFELRAVSTSRRESAEAAERAFRVPAFDNATALIAHPDVELVVVSVKVPEHHALIAEAIDAGKMVFSEWPLGVDLAEAEDLAARAEAAGVRTAIALQARFAPAVQHARALVAEGYVGDILATTLTGSGMAWGPEVKRSQTYAHDAASGVNVLSVSMLHALEAVNFALGDFRTVAASTAVRRPTVRIIEDGSSHRVTAPDHVALTGTLESGAFVSAFYRGGSSRAGNLRWEINGTEGDLLITAPYGNLQVADLVLEGGRADQASVSRIAVHAGDATGFGVNILREYAALARDIREGTRLVPDFAYAVRRHRLLAAIQEAARSGVTQHLD